MKTPRTLLDRPGRIAAVVGAVVAVSATTLMAVVAGSAAADEPGRCVENVNVRSTPSLSAEIIKVCEQGTAVQVGETRNGFVELTDLNGWAAQEFISVNGQAPAAATEPSTPTTSSTSSTSPRSTTTGTRSAAPTSAVDDDDADPTTQARRAPRESSSPTTSSSADRTFPRETAPTPEPEPEADASPVGGLLG